LFASAGDDVTPPPPLFSYRPAGEAPPEATSEPARPVQAIWKLNITTTVVFTWDDWQAGQASGPYLPPPNRIVGIREERWKLAEYYDAAGQVPSQWEMYDLHARPLEAANLAWEGCARTPEQEAEYARLRLELAEIRETRLAPLAGAG